jgi:hypothetical protein
LAIEILQPFAPLFNNKNPHLFPKYFVSSKDQNGFAFFGDIFRLNFFIFAGVKIQRLAILTNCENNSILL